MTHTDKTPGLIAIAAMADNRVIGIGGKLPWRLPEDMAFFKRTTMGHVLVMGRRTFESIGRPLPGRETVVLSRSMTPQPGCRVARDPAEILELAHRQTIFVAGGAEVYRLLLPACHTLLLTRVRGDFPGDVFFPEFEYAFPAPETLYSDERCEILSYERTISLSDSEIARTLTTRASGGSNSG